MSASLLVTADIGALWWMLEHHFLDVLKSYRVWHEGTIWYVDSCSHLFSEYRVSSFFFFFIPPWKVYWIDHCYFFQCECIPCHFKGIAYEIRYFQLIIARTWWVWSRNVFFVSVFWNKSSKGTKVSKISCQPNIYIYIAISSPWNLVPWGWGGDGNQRSNQDITGDIARSNSTIISWRVWVALWCLETLQWRHGEIGLGECQISMFNFWGITTAPASCLQSIFV